MSIKTWIVVFFQDYRGDYPVIRYIEKLTKKEQAVIAHDLELLEEFGPDLRMPIAARVRGELWELRSGNHRLFYFAFIDNQFVILHAYRKKSQKAPEREINIAFRRLEQKKKEKP